jgi:hypothetical protein
MWKVVGIERKVVKNCPPNCCGRADFWTGVEQGILMERR